MPRREYQKRLETLRTDVCEMGDRVLDRYDQALYAYETGDETLANGVISGDHEINELYLDLESDCIDLIALQQPVAGDLRFVAASFKIITDLERIGDLATNLARYAISADSDVHSTDELAELGEMAGEMVADAVAAYETGDASACRSIAARDDELDAACETASERVFGSLLDSDFDPSGTISRERILDDVSTALLTIRDLERVGDHAVNISARAFYMVENDDELIY